MKKSHISWPLVITCAVVGTGIGLTAYAYPKVMLRFNPPENDVVIETPTPKPLLSASPITAVSPTPILPTAVSVPEHINYDVTFTPQAPFANWDATHEETCEEASLLMAYWYAKGIQGEKTGTYQNIYPAQKAEDELMALVKWQNDTFGYFEDTAVAEVVRIAKEKYGLTDVTVKDNPSVNDLRQALAQEKVILVPAAGEEMENPYFKQPGPPYHMILLRGYNSSGFISNDPGTRRGEGFVYPEDNVMEFMHDWTGRDSTITQGAKRVIFIGKEVN